MSDSDFEDLSIHISNEELVMELKQKDKLLKQKDVENGQLIQNLVQQKQQNSKLAKALTQKDVSLRMLSQNIFALSQKTLEIDNQRMTLNGKLIDAQVEHKNQKERLLNQNSTILNQLQSTLGELYRLKNQYKVQTQQNHKNKSVFQEQIKKITFQKQKSILVTSQLKLQIQALAKRSREEQKILKNKNQQAIDKLQLYKINNEVLSKKLQQIKKKLQQSQNNRIYSEKVVQELQQKLIVQREKQDNLASQTFLYEEFVNEIKKQAESVKKQMNSQTESFKNKNKDLEAQLEQIKKDFQIQSVKLFELYKKNKQNDIQMNELKQNITIWKKSHQNLQQHCLKIEEMLQAKDKQLKLNKGYTSQLEKQIKRLKIRIQQIQLQKKNEIMTLQMKKKQLQEQINVLKKASLSEEEIDQYKTLTKLLRTMEDQNKELVKDYKEELSEKNYQIESLEQNICIVKQSNIILEKEIEAKLKIITDLESHCLSLQTNLENYRFKQSQCEAKARIQLQNQILELNKKVNGLQMKKKELQSNIQAQNKQIQESGRRQAQLEKQYDSIICDLINQNNKKNIKN